MFAILLLSSQKSDVICEKLYVYISRIYVFLIHSYKLIHYKKQKAGSNQWHILLFPDPSGL
jgi:hypothetical protein